MGDLLTMWWKIPATIERLTGSGPYGDSFAAPTVEHGRVRRGNKLVRNKDGVEVVASATWSGPLDTERIPVGSLVTIEPDETPRLVIAEGRHESGTGMTPDFYSIELQ